MSLTGRNILVGITGGIAAYKIPSLIRTLVRKGAQVQAVVTQNGARFVGEAALSTITRRPVLTTLFPDNREIVTSHIAATDWAHALLVAPATANCLAKFAAGLADDFLSTCYLSMKGPVVVAPAMNEAMWAHPAVAANVAVLKKRGVTVVEPAEGELACGVTGRGRLPDEEVLVHRLEQALTPQDFAGKRVLVTGGGTEEPLDPVRVLTNRSSGRMGLALAERAMARGAALTLIHGRVSVRIPGFIPAVEALTVSDMLSTLKDRFQKSDYLFMAAAVGDFTPVRASDKKIKKQGKGLSLDLVETPDILKALSRNKGRRKIIGFALEDGNALDNGLRKLREKGCDLLVLNGPAALGSKENSVTLLFKDGSAKPFGPLLKEGIADLILDHAKKL